MSWGQILGAIAAPLIGGLFGSRQAKIDRRNALADGQVQFERLRESAERADFNPLTALTHGGLGAFQNIPSGAPPLASTQFLTEGVQGVADILTGKDAQKQAREQLEMDLMKLQMESYKADIAASTVRTQQAQLGRQPPRAPKANGGGDVYTMPPLSPAVAWPVGTPTGAPAPVPAGHPGVVRPPTGAPGGYVEDTGYTVGNPDYPTDPEEFFMRQAMDHNLGPVLDRILEGNGVPPWIVRRPPPLSWNGVKDNLLPPAHIRGWLWDKTMTDEDRRFNMQ